MALATENSNQQRPETPPTAIQIPKPMISPYTATQSDTAHPSQPLKSGHLNLDTFSPVNQNGSFEFDRVLRSGKVHRRVKKKGAWKPSWKPAQLVLRPNILSLYKDEEATELWAAINLSDVTTVAPVKKSNTQNVFGVFSPSKNYQFQGQSQRDTKAWIDCIRNETPVDADEEFFFPGPENRSRQRSNTEHQITYETSDFSDAYEDRASSPEPSKGSLKGRKGRSRANTAQRIPSQIHEYSGNEMMTSYSDFSDGAPAGSVSYSMPRSTLGTSPPNHRSLNKNTPYMAAVSSPPAQPLAIGNLSQVSINEPAPSENIASSIGVTLDPSRVIRQGYLLTLRRSSGVKSWKRLWVVLRSKSLSFYKTEAEYSLLKLVDMSNVINAAEIDPISRTKRFCFQIILEDKTYRFSCGGEEDLEAWLGALKSVLSRMKRERANSGMFDSALAAASHAVREVTLS